ILGSSSLDDMLSRIDDSNTISHQDASTVRTVIRFRSEIRQREVRLQHARATKADLVQNLADERSSIESQLSERKALLSSIQGEIVRLKAEEAARQAQLKRQLEARIAAQQQAAATRALQPSLPTAFATPTQADTSSTTSSTDSTAATS